MIRGDLLLKHKFADGIFTEHQSVTEDWELSIRSQRDGYYIQVKENIAVKPKKL